VRPRNVVLAVVVELLVTYVVNRLFGTPWQWAALIALPLAALTLLAVSTPAGVEPAWGRPPAPPAVAGHLEAGLLASRLADAANDQSRYRSRVQPRLAAIALAALRHRPGLADVADLRDPRAAAELGPHRHALLTDPAATQPEPAALLALLEGLEER
jgi:hypothetical protein